jgi:hypothetical protein
MKLIKTMSYTSSSADNRGFQQKPNINKSEDAIDFENGITMTLSSCLSHLSNNNLISWKEKKSIASKNTEVIFNKIAQFKNTFLSL